MKGHTSKAFAFWTTIIYGTAQKADPCLQYGYYGSM